MPVLWAYLISLFICLSDSRLIGSNVKNRREFNKQKAVCPWAVQALTFVAMVYDEMHIQEANLACFTVYNSIKK